MKKILNSIGGLLLMYGIGSIILNLFNYEYIIFIWLGFFPPVIAWAIRIFMVVLGGAMLLGSKIMSE
jgi:hypothetical protein